MTLSLYNTLTRRKDEFKPIDDKNVRMYVCGPTVYDRPHLGNARSVVVYDVLYRLLMHIYGRDHVTYVRNITDVDDKINAAAKANGEPISGLTKRVEGWFEEDMKALNCLKPTHEPHATQHIQPMVAMIEKLIANGHAYESQGHVLFKVASYKEYGALSGRKLEDLIAGARVEVESYKQHPGDFVLWKPAEDGDDASSVFQSPWGPGRPGWHIECSAMSDEYLGKHFDIHGGGADLMFPHHENEIAQSRCADSDSQFANYWVHNGFLTVNGEKMSKSLGNFTTVKDLLDKGVKGEVIRLALLTTHYRKPLDWTEKAVLDANFIINRLYNTYYNHQVFAKVIEHPEYSLWYSRYDNFVKQGQWDWELADRSKQLFEDFAAALNDDMNISVAFSKMLELTKPNERNGQFYPSDYFSDRVTLKKCGDILGLIQGPDFIYEYVWKKGAEAKVREIVIKVDARIAAKKAKNWAEADRIRKELSEQGIILEDKPDGTTDWRKA